MASVKHELQQLRKKSQVELPPTLRSEGAYHSAHLHCTNTQCGASVASGTMSRDALLPPPYGDDIPQGDDVRAGKGV